MDPQTGQAAFRIAFFVILLSAGLLPFLARGSAEFVVDVLALSIGLVFATVIALFVRRSARG